MKYFTKGRKMADDTDFVALYDELGLDAECSMADFKHAYRRRVARLHPDHTGNPSDIPRLQRLNRLYAAALDFEHAHGRLPGASRTSSGRAYAHGHAHPLRPEAGTPVDPVPMPVAGSARRWRYLLVLGVVALVLYWSSRPATSVSTFAQQTGSGTSRAEVHAPVPHGFVELGMGTDQVRKIQGEPFNSHEYRWEYGPSWIQFECHQVSDWYSSPLHPLRVKDANGQRTGAGTASKPGRC